MQNQVIEIAWAKPPGLSDKRTKGTALRAAKFIIKLD